MKRISRIISLGLLIPILFLCFKKKEEPFRVTYKVQGYADCPYDVNISYTDSTRKESWVRTNNKRWSKTVCLPKDACASLVAYPAYGQRMTGLDVGPIRMCYDDTPKISLSAKIMSGNRVVWGEGSKIITLMLLPEDGM